MTPNQRALARHALGLPNARKRSYRNYYAAVLRTPDEQEWFDLCGEGLAVIRTQGTMTGFALTHAGALAALDPGETLDPEDFPANQEPAT